MILVLTAVFAVANAAWVVFDIATGRYGLAVFNASVSGWGAFTVVRHLIRRRAERRIGGCP